MTRTFVLGGEREINRIGFGTMRLTGPQVPGFDDAITHVWRAPADRDAAIAVVRQAVELGVDLIDTADSYALGESEELLARALHPYREQIVIATKVGVARPSPVDWVPLGNPAYLRQQVELSLRRLRTERLDLLQLHRVDPAYPLADQVGALAELREQGKIALIGLSEVGVEQLAEAAAITPIAAVQNLYNLTDRHHEPVLDYARAHGIAFLPWFPLGAGHHAAAGGPLAEVAAELGASPVRVSLAWLLRHAPNTVPIPGTTSTAHLIDNIAAGDLTLSDDQYRRLSTVAASTVPG